MNDDLAPLLSTLPEPAAPTSITASVMARIEREAAAQHAEAAAPIRRPHGRDSWMWITACLGILLVVGATASNWYNNGLPPVFSPQLLRGGLDAALGGWQSTVAGLTGLTLCLRALFAPLRSDRG